MAKKTQPSGPMDALFKQAKVAKVIDYLAIQKEHQTKTEICRGAKVPRRSIDAIIITLLKLDIIGVGAQIVDERKGIRDNSYYIRNDTASGKAIHDLHEYIRRLELAKVAI
jgi:hypothetical protein